MSLTWTAVKWAYDIATTDWSTLDAFLKVIPTWLPIGIMCLAIFTLFLEVVMESVQDIPYMYRLPLRLITIMVFAFGAYLKGRQDVVLNYEHKLEKVTAQQVIVTKNIKNKYAKQITTIQQKNDELKRQINSKDDSDCELPASFVRLHNDSVESGVSRTAK